MKNKPKGFPLKDIHDGQEYKSQQFLQQDFHLSFTLNTDGVAMFRSSSKDLWPVYLTINELPPQIRYVIIATVMHVSTDA